MKEALACESRSFFAPVLWNMPKAHGAEHTLAGDCKVRQTVKV